MSDPNSAGDDFVFRDLNKNGRLDPYEDHRRPIHYDSENPLFPFGHGLTY